jgi:periplasmic protein TonB
MPYESHANPRHRMAILAGVAVIHAIGIYALIHGLGGAIATLIERHNPSAIFITQTPPPQPVPKPQPRMDKPLSEPVTTATTLEPLLRPSEVLPGPMPLNPAPWPGPTATPSPVDTTPPVPTVHHVDAIGARPVGKPGSWATPEDYPSLDLNAEHEGVTHFSLSIDAQGRVSGCTVTGTSGWPGLDTATCRLIMKRARFSPAMDENGQPTTGGFASAVRWTIPR